jgi:cytochrome c556
MKMFRIIAVSLMFSMLGLAMVSAQDAEKKEPTKEEKAVKGRQELMHVLAAQRAVMRDMAEGKRPTDAVAFTNAANALAALSIVIPEAFTLNAIVGDSTAKPDVWTNAADFAAKSKALADKGVAIAAMAATDIEGAKTLVKDMKECGGCHDQYRVEDDK